MSRVVSTPTLVDARKVLLSGLHILLAAAMVLLSLLAHGRVPGMTADESAALGFVFFFGLGLPLVLVSVGTLVWSLLSKDEWYVALAASLLVSFVATANVWTGVLVSLTYLSLASWTMAQRLRQRT